MSKFFVVILFLCPIWLLSQEAFPFNSFHGSTKEPLRIHVKNENSEKSYLETHMPKGKIYLVSIWATWCGSCRAELRTIQKHYCNWEDEYGLEFLAISIDTPNDHPKVFEMTNKMGWGFKTLHDEYGYLVGELGVSKLPRLFLVDRNGNIVYEPEGYSNHTIKTLEEKIRGLMF